MKIFQIIVISVALIYGTMANAALLSVSGDNSTRGVAAAIIGAPANALDAMKTNEGQEGFNERQNYVLLAAIDTDAGSIASGIRVDSHMIFLNKYDGDNISHNNVLWTFSGAILGVMSDRNGIKEEASTDVLGNPGTNYPAGGFSARGMEGADSYSILAGLGIGNQLSVNMVVAQPGDWIRVVTASAVPVPAAVWLFGTALVGLIGFGKRKASVSA